MYRVEQEEPSTDFKEAWSAAGRHIQSQADTGLSWLRATLNPPMAEHLSFRIGNQIFFVFVDAAEFNYESGRQLFSKVCSMAGAVPCLMPMEKWLGRWRGFYPVFTDGYKTPENSKSLLATLRRIRGLWNRSM